MNEMTSEPADTNPPPAAAPGFFPPKSTLLGDIVSRLLGFVSKILTPELLDSLLGSSKRLGHFTVLIGAAATVIYGLIVAIKLEQFALVVTSLLFVAVIAVAQFAASRFLDAADKIIANTPSRVSTPAFFECTGLIVIIGAVAVLFSGFGAAIYVRSFAPVVPALIGFVLLLSFASIMLHPGSVNVAVGEGSAGEEAIGILTTFMKAWLKLIPIAFFLVSALGTLIVLAGFFGDRAASQFAQMLPVPTSGLPLGFAGSALVVVACLAPLLFYFLFLLQYLLLDVVRAVLAVPGKLDTLRR